MDVYGVTFFNFFVGSGPSAGISLSYVWDDNGAAGLLVTGHGGYGAGIFGSISEGIFHSPYKNIEDLTGMGLEVSAGAGAGWSFLADKTNSTDFGISSGPGEGLMAFAGVTYSRLYLVNELTNLKKATNNIKIQYKDGLILVYSGTVLITVYTIEAINKMLKGEQKEKSKDENKKMNLEPLKEIRNNYWNETVRDNTDWHRDYNAEFR